MAFGYIVESGRSRCGKLLRNMGFEANASKSHLLPRSPTTVKKTDNRHVSLRVKFLFEFDCTWRVCAHSKTIPISNDVAILNNELSYSLEPKKWWLVNQQNVHGYQQHSNQSIVSWLCLQERSGAETTMKYIDSRLKQTLLILRMPHTNSHYANDLYRVIEW